MTSTCRKHGPSPEHLLYAGLNSQPIMLAATPENPVATPIAIANTAGVIVFTLECGCLAVAMFPRSSAGDYDQQLALAHSRTTVLYTYWSPSS